MIVTCARCLAEYPEDSDDVRYAEGDWWCADEDACAGGPDALLEAINAI